MTWRERAYDGDEDFALNQTLLNARRISVARKMEKQIAWAAIEGALEKALGPAVKDVSTDVYGNLHLGPTLIAAIAEFFCELDADSGGSIEIEELAVAMHDRFGLAASQADLEKMIAAADTDGNGTLELDEFEDVVKDVLAKAHERGTFKGQPVTQAALQRGRRHSLVRAAQSVEQTICKALGADATSDIAADGVTAGPVLTSKVADLFQRMDRSGKGSINGDAFATVMRNEFAVVSTRDALCRLVEAADADGNGTLEFDELLEVQLRLEVSDGYILVVKRRDPYTPRHLYERLQLHLARSRDLAYTSLFFLVPRPPHRRHPQLDACARARRVCVVCARVVRVCGVSARVVCVVRVCGVCARVTRAFGLGV